MELNRYETSGGILLEYQDDCYSNPREDMECMGTFYTFLRRKFSPDKHNFENAKEWMDDILGKSPSKKKADEAFREGKQDEGAKIVVEALEKKGFVSLPVWYFEHGNCSYQAAEKNPFSCPWDSCLAGFIYVSKNKIQQEYGKRVSPALKKTVLQVLKGEVALYSYYANGEVYAYAMEDDPDECVGGFYGPIEENGAPDEFGVTLV